MKNKELKIIFAGTPTFAVPTLEAIYESGYDIPLVLTQPDRKSGRGMIKKPSPIKEKAKQYNIPVYQPEKLEGNEVIKKITGTKADILVVAAYGLIIPSKILDIFVKGSYNVHASLLPAWRGAAPVHRAIEAGDSKTGVTIMFIAPELDSGDILRKKIIILNEDSTTGEVTEKLSKLGAELMTKVLNDICANKKLKLIPQIQSMATYAKKINKSEAKIIWKDVTSKVLVCKINAFNPNPGAFCFFRGKILKIWKANIESNIHKIETGKLFVPPKENNLYAGTIDAAIQIILLQQEGKRKMTAKEFIVANKINDEDFLL
ncbi:methionyl-tRNA formyltransferase [Nitrosomonadales bacterium]|nr:methionyl-tRNA formyltransferase [Nitrosomonadales bacterium]